MAVSRPLRPMLPAPTPPAKRLDGVVVTLSLILVAGTALLAWFLALVF